MQVAGLKRYSPPSISVALIKPPSRAKRGRVSRSKGGKKANRKRQSKAIGRKNAQSGRELKPKPRKKTKWDRGSKAKASEKATITDHKSKPEPSKTATVQTE